MSEQAAGDDRSTMTPRRRLTPYLAVIPALALACGLVWGVLHLTGGGPSPASGVVTSGGAAGAGEGDGLSAEALVAGEQAAITANKLIEAGEFAQARVVLDAALAKQPSNDRLLRLNAELCFHEGDAGAAYDAMDRAIAVGDDLPEYRFAAAVYAMQIELYEHAETHLLKAQNDAPGNPKYAIYLAVLQHQYLDDSLEAKKNLLLATQADDALHQAWALLAEIALAENRPAVGLQHIERARRVAPGVSAYRVTHARLLRRNNMADEAVALMLTMPEFELLSDAAILAEAATCLGMAGRPGEAADLYLRSLTYHAGEAGVVYEAALWLQRAGRPAEALPLAERAEAGGWDQASALVDSLRSVDGSGDGPGGEG